jgi:hypothetical protein
MGVTNTIRPDIILMNINVKEHLRKATINSKRIFDMIKAERISVEDAYRKVQAKEALLVCGYNDEEKFKTMQLEGAISYSEFESRLPKISKDQELIFY